MRRVLLTLLLCLAFAPLTMGQQGQAPFAAFWNVENLFDTRHDTLRDDLSFTPAGDHHWTPQRYAAKQAGIFKVIAAMDCPALVGLAEVENDFVLRDLCRSTPLRRWHYDFVHFESPDRRGVDCALLYRRDLFRCLGSRPICVSDSSQAFFTRDILLVGGLLLPGGDTCYLLVNHWPSKLGGGPAEQRRLRIAQRMLAVMDSLQQCHPSALVMAMGDFNASPDEEAVRLGLRFYGTERNDLGFTNLTAAIPRGTGSYKYRDSWSCIDQVIANRPLEVSVFAPDFLLQDDPRYLGRKPFRTYSGMRYLGGFSDHLPVYLDLPLLP